MYIILVYVWGMTKNRLFPILIIFFISITVWIVYYWLVTSRYLSFSDAAKYANIAENIIKKKSFVSDFTFFGTDIFKHSFEEGFSTRGVPVAMPFSLVGAFKLLNISDFAVVFVSGLYYVLLVVFTYLLAKRLFGVLVGFLSSVAIALNLNFLDYATSGASETLFSFIAILAVYFAFLKKKWTDILFFLALVLLYLTRPQGFLFILIIFFIWLASRISIKKAIVSSFVFLITIYFIDKFILYPLSWKTNVYPIFTRGLQAFFQYSSNFAVSDALRGGVARNVDLIGLMKKVFYNLYNFYKLLPQIAAPYMWALFAIGLFVWDKNKDKKIFKLTTILLVAGNFLLVALTIPFYRYLHPVIPFVYIISVATLVTIIEKIAKKRYVALISSALIFVFVVGQTLGVIFLDSRFVTARTNKGEPPVYVKLSYILKDNTNKDDIVITNLDTWGTWYGERRTVWYPLKPDMLNFEEFEEPPFDAIYLTSYKIDDENYYMGKEWRVIFDNPRNSKLWDNFISDNYEFANEFRVNSEETYEKQAARAVLFTRKTY